MVGVWVRMAVDRDGARSTGEHCTGGCTFIGDLELCVDRWRSGFGRFATTTWR
jgi:hypothetical protein